MGKFKKAMNKTHEVVAPNTDNAIFFLTLFFVCVWLIVDCAVGKNYLGSFLSAIFPSLYEKKSTTVTYEAKLNPNTGEFYTVNDDGSKNVLNPNKGENNAPNSSAIGGYDGTTTTTPNTVPYGATRAN